MNMIMNDHAGERTANVPREPRSRSKQARYEQVLETAARVFARNGYAEATIQQIAAELDMTGAALYYYFKNKDELLYEIWRRAGAKLQAMIEEVLELDATPEEKLRLAFRRHLEVIIGDKPIFEVLILQRTRLPEYGREQLVEDERTYVRTFSHLLEQLPEQTLGKRHPRIVTLGIISTLNAVIRWYSPGEKMSLGEIADIYYKIFLNGAFTPSPQLDL